MSGFKANFLKMPRTSFGWWAVGLSIVSTTLLFLVASDILALSGFMTAAFAVVTGILTVLAVFWKGERSWLVLLMLLPAVFIFTFVLGEILYPH